MNYEENETFAKSLGFYLKKITKFNLKSKL